MAAGRSAAETTPRSSWLCIIVPIPSPASDHPKIHRLCAPRRLGGFRGGRSLLQSTRVCAGLGTTVLLGPKVTVKVEAGQPNKRAMDDEDLRSYREAMMRGPLRALLGGDKRLARVRQ